MLESIKRSLQHASVQRETFAGTNRCISGRVNVRVCINWTALDKHNELVSETGFHAKGYPLRVKIPRRDKNPFSRSMFIRPLYVRVCVCVAFTLCDN